MRAWEEHQIIATHIFAGVVDEAFQAATRHIERAGRDLSKRLSAA